jgi:hypothetical protein
MPIRVMSIVDITPSAERTAQFGRYRVTLNDGGTEEVLIYTVELPQPGTQSLSWRPSDSILADPQRVDVLTVAALSDLIVAFHRGERFQLPREVPPLSVGPETAVLRL